MKEALHQYFSQYTDIPDTELERLVQHLKHEKLAKGDFLVRFDEPATKLSFIRKGVFKVFFTAKSGHEYITEISSEGCVVGAYSDMLMNRRSTVQIMALELSEISAITYNDFCSLYRYHACWQELGRKIAEKLFVEREEREKSMAMFSGEERYELFTQQKPHLAGRIPQNQIALYLGLNAASLSRIRSKKK